LTSSLWRGSSRPRSRTGGQLTRRDQVPEALPARLLTQVVVDAAAEGKETGILENCGSPASASGFSGAPISAVHCGRAAGARNAPHWLSAV
jgi:hypothetical protein